MIIALAVLNGAYLLIVGAWNWFSDAPEQRGVPNPDVFPAFRAIEQRCMAESWPHQTLRCQGALDKLKACRQSRDDCTAIDYYCTLAKLGFELDLPPYHGSESPYIGKRACR